ncbi:MAG: hypothetical protein KC464_16920 [Myxococcales bacterium]|nr:hypothetical protein [Myxococcales bacterium]
MLSTARTLALGLLGLSLAVAVPATPAHAGDAGDTGDLGDDTASGAAADADGAANVTHPKNKHKKKKKKRKHARHPDSWVLTVAADAEATAGALTGAGIVRDSGAFVRVEADAKPRLAKGKLRLELPVSLEDRETFGASLAQRIGEIEARVQVRDSARLRGTVSGGVAGTWRPDWPDPYQPLPDGTLAGSSRHSHFDGKFGLEVAGIPVRHQHARLTYDFKQVDYADDANYDPFDAPTHLMPADHTEHAFRAGWHWLGDGAKLGGDLRLTYTSYENVFSRDAGTGLTHAGAGGPPPNPLETTLDVEPSIDGELELGRVTVGAGYELTLSSDRYQGYYSYVEHHPELDVDVVLVDDAKLELAVDLYRRRYGANSYAVNPPTHPALEDGGDRRAETRWHLGADLRWPLGDGGLAAIAGVDVKARESNFPDYIPGVYPATRAYDIDWDYTDATAWIGVAWRRGRSDD